MNAKKFIIRTVLICLLVLSLLTLLLSILYFLIGWVSDGPFYVKRASIVFILSAALVVGSILSIDKTGKA
jgi:uncharacterized membrane protein